MDAELKSLIIVLGFNFALTLIVVTIFTGGHYFKNKKINRIIRTSRSGSDGLLFDEEEEKRMIDDIDYHFGPTKEEFEDTLSSGSFGDIDSSGVRNYKDKRKMPPKLDPWLFKWIYQIYKISDREVFQFTPTDGYLYLYFLKGASILFLFLSFLNGLILIPIYAGEGKLGAKNDLQVLTIGNIVNYSNNSKMWAVFSVSLLVSFASYFFIYKQKKRIDKVNYLTYDESLTDLDISKYTLLIRNVPKTLRTADGDNMLYHFFRETYRDQVLGAHIIPNLAHLEDVMEQRNLFLKKLGYYVELNNRNSTRTIIKLGPKILFCRRRKVDAVNYYKDMIQKIDSIIPKLKTHGFKENTGVAYVTFSSKETQQKCLKDFKYIRASPMGFINRQLQVQDWKIETGSDPSDIIWKNLNKNYSTRYLYKVMISLLVLMISFMGICPLSIVDKLDYIRIKEGNFIYIVIESYFSPIFLFLISSIFIPWLIRKLSEYEYLERKSYKESTIMNKSYLFIFINSTLVPMVTLTMLQAFIINRDIDYDGFLNRVSHSTEFLFRFIIQITFLSGSIQLFAAPFFASKKFRNWVNYEFKDENWEFQDWFFNIGYSVPYNGAVFTLILMFSTIVPLILPFGSVFFYIKYLLDKYNIIYVCPDQFESAGKISRNKTLYYSIFAVILYQISMVIVLIITEDILMYTLLIVISVFGTIAIIYIATRKNFRLNQVENTKQRKLSFILNPSTNNKFSAAAFLDEEINDEISDRLKHAYIHPCEKTFHAPVFKRNKGKQSMNFLFDFEESTDNFARKSLSEDGHDTVGLLSDKDDREEGKSDTYKEKVKTKFNRSPHRAPADFTIQ